MNLLAETLEVMQEHGKTKDDVEWVGGDLFWFAWPFFEEMASKTEYNCGYGGQLVAYDLKVVGSDWWLERHEYDGSEWWEYKSKPSRPSEHKVPARLVGDLSWCTLENINNGGKDDEEDL